MSAKRRKKKRSGAVGLLFLELIGVVAFAFLITTAQDERQSDADHSSAGPAAMNMAPATTTFDGYQVGNNQAGNSPAQQEPAGWNQHRPQFSQVLGNIWEAGF